MTQKRKIIHKKLLIGRNEWCQLPGLNIPAIRAKIDTGAKTSAIHAFNIKPLHRETYVRFDVHPLQGDESILIHCQAPILDKRYIMSSNGHKEHRYVIVTSLKIDGQCWDIELTLSNRDPLRHRMLLGRQALNHRVVIDPGIVCNQTTLLNETVLELYSHHGAHKIVID
ncbi:MAG: ATP-dependent zinc protease [Legionellales bacterium]|nr:ATP-dependent zinc protease [Legionellales bacterium]